MPSTVIVNFRPVIHKGSGSVGQFTMPDICKTPVPVAGSIPLPWPNFSFSNTLSGGTSKVKVEGSPVMTKGAKFSKSTGDEGGTGKGIVSSTVTEELEAVSFSFNVKFEGANVCRMADTTLQNKKNTMGILI